LCFKTPISKSIIEKGKSVFSAKVKKPTQHLKCEGRNVVTMLTTEEKNLLARAANLMEELLETIEVTENKQIAKELKAALKEVDEAKTPIQELIQELSLEQDVHL
jgi:hypothetical protein